MFGKAKDMARAMKLAPKIQGLAADLVATKSADELEQMIIAEQKQAIADHAEGKEPEDPDTHDIRMGAAIAAYTALQGWGASDQDKVQEFVLKCGQQAQKQWEDEQ